MNEGEFVDEKDIHFTNKHVDESWKDAVSGQKEKSVSEPEPKPQATEGVDSSRVNFHNFITSLGMQALLLMGEIKAPGAEKIEVNLEAAQELIDLLVMLRGKTKGNLSQEEDKMLNTLIAEIQLKYVEHSREKA